MVSSSALSLLDPSRAAARHSDIAGNAGMTVQPSSAAGLIVDAGDDVAAASSGPLVTRSALRATVSFDAPSPTAASLGGRSLLYDTLPADLLWPVRPPSPTVAPVLNIGVNRLALSERSMRQWMQSSYRQASSSPTLRIQPAAAEAAAAVGGGRRGGI